MTAPVDRATPPHAAIFVAGHPAPQGSKRHVGNGVMVEMSKRVAPWRQDVREALLRPGGGPRIHFLAHTPVRITLTFVMPRPASHRNKPSPPHTKRPDLDKLVRAVLDAIGSAGVWHDDSQVTAVSAAKTYAEVDETPGCWIAIEEYL